MRLKKLRVVKNDRSPTGYNIMRGDDGGVPATFYEIDLWKLYIEALDMAVRIRKCLSQESAAIDAAGRNSVVEGKGKS